MRDPFHLSSLLGAAALGLVAMPAAAQDTTLPASDQNDAFNSSITVGVAAAYLPDYEGSNDYRFVPAPAAIGAISGFTFQLAGNRLSVDVIPDRPSSGWDFQAGPLGVINLNRNSRKSIDDPRVKALGKLDTAIELGGYVGIGKVGVITSPYDRLSVTVSYRHDVAGAHKDGIWQPSVTYFTPLSRKAGVGLFASAERTGGKYADYYFSVTPAQSAISGLPSFNARSGGKNWTAGALGTIALTGDLLKGWKLVGGGTYKKMLNSFGNSPLVSVAGKRSQWLGAIGIAYTF